MDNKNKWEKIEVIFELLVFGIAIGILEDIVAIKLATNEPITWDVVGVVVLVAIPFAILGEVIFDRIDFATMFEKFFSKKNKQDKEPLS